METATSPKANLQSVPASPQILSPGVDEQDILRHLLEVESNAAALVDDAQAEADRRLAEGEKKSRSHSDEIYAREAAVLEADYTQAIGAVKAGYQGQIDAYRASLDSMAVHRDDFFRLVERYLGKDQ